MQELYGKWEAETVGATTVKVLPIACMLRVSHSLLMYLLFAGSGVPLLLIK